MGTTNGKDQVIPLDDPHSHPDDPKPSPDDAGAKHHPHASDDVGKHTTTTGARKRQVGVSAEKMKKGDDMEMIPIPKSEEAKTQIAAALKTNALFLNMDAIQVSGTCGV